MIIPEFVLERLDCPKLETVQELASGHINKTLVVETAAGKQVVQKINGAVFPSFAAILNNNHKAAHLLKESKTVTDRIETFEFELVSGAEDLWRICPWIESIDFAQNPEDIYEVALAYGDFNYRLKGADPAEFMEVIPNFHNTQWRLGHFKKSVLDGFPERIGKAKDLISEIEKRENYAKGILELVQKGEIAASVNHNDAKLTNIIKSVDGHLTVIDWDTIMPGNLLFDLGDLVRSAAPSHSEAHTEIQEIAIVPENFRAITLGFSEGLGLSAHKLESLTIVAGKVIIYEQTLRFLSDYLTGDKYYGEAFLDQNLLRARNQMQLLRSLEELVGE